MDWNSYNWTNTLKLARRLGQKKLVSEHEAAMVRFSRVRRFWTPSSFAKLTVVNAAVGDPPPVPPNSRAVFTTTLYCAGTEVATVAAAETSCGEDYEVCCNKVLKRLSG